MSSYFVDVEVGMIESGSAEQCFATAMTAALDPYGEFVDIMEAESFRIWHNVPGLKCVVCEHPVEVYRSSLKNPYVRHGKGHGIHGTSAQRKTAGETFLHRRFKYWVRHELRRRGVDAEVEVWQGGRRPDVYGTRDGQAFAVEIQWSPLSFEDARARTAHYRDVTGAEVLWLTRSCSWVEKLPALGIKSFTPTAGGDYLAHTGHLRRTGRAVLKVEPIAVRSFFDAWIDGELAWGYRDTEKAGWATVTDWTAYTAEQAADLDKARRNLDAANTRLTQQGNTIRLQSGQITLLKEAKARIQRELEERTGERDAARGERDSFSDSISSATRRIADLTTEAKRAADDLSDSESTVAQRNIQLGQLGIALAKQRRYLRILLCVMLILVLAAIAGWM